jgi:Pyridine nucleotide-disulphide oxidoreductase
MLNGGLIAAPCRQHLRVVTNKPTDERLEPRLRKDEESVMMATVNNVVVGGGQAGLSVSHYLKQLSVDHVVLEQADKPGEAWRNHCWDSFALNTPRWQSRLLGVRNGEDDSDGSMPRREVVAHLDEMAQRLPVRTRARVVSVTRDAATGDYVVSIDGGEKIRARNVVVATGLYQTPKIPEFGRDLTLPVLRDGFDQRILTELDLAAAGVTNVIWATGYTFDFSMIRLAVTDDDGFPIQTRGVSAFPGLFFVGLPWLHTAKSGLIFGVSEDARYIAERIAERRDAAEDERAISLLLERSRSQEPKRSRATRKWADGVTALASAAIVSLALTASSAAEAPLPPRVNFIPTPAGQLYLGMTTRSGSWAKLQGRQTSQSARHKYASLNSSTQFPAKSSSRTEKCRTSGWTRSGWKRILSRRPPGRPGWGSQAARCDAPSVNLKPFFITPSSGSASISGFTRAPARTSVCSSGPTA